MRLTVQVQLLVSPEDTSLLETVRMVNAACNWLSEQAWKSKTFRHYDLHKLAYYTCRAKFPRLSAQMVVLAIAKVANSYKLDKKSRHDFRLIGSIAYDARVLSWRLTDSTVSIWTTEGREHIGFVCGERQEQLLQHDRGEAKLVYRNGRFYLYVVVNIPDPEQEKVTEFIGIDLGVKLIAADSDGNIYDEPRIEKVRQRRTAHRQRLGKAAGARKRRGSRPRSIRRAIRRHKRKERRFRTDVNHTISKRIVVRAKDTGRGIALEDLTGIRTRTEKRLRRSQRSRHASWSFSQLRSFFAYKAKLAGVTVALVDPRNTSRICAECGYCDKKNRKTQAEFVCQACGHMDNADINAARNIGQRAVVNQPMVSEKHETFSPA